MLEGSLGGHGRALGRLLRAGDHALAGEGEGLGKSSHGDGVPWNDFKDKKVAVLASKICQLEERIPTSFSFMTKYSYPTFALLKT